MRQAGTLSNRDQAERLADYLLTKGIEAKVEPEGPAWALWVRDEDHLPQARQELQEFLVDPAAQRYRGVDGAAEALRKQQQRTETQRQKSLVMLRDRWDTRPTGRQPLTLILIAISALVFFLSGSAAERGTIEQYLWFGKPPTDVGELLTWNGMAAIEHGEVWRLVTPIFIHAEILHLAFNMYWLYLFGSLIEARRGTVQFGLLVLATAALSNWGQYDFSVRQGVPPLMAIFFGGMSGVNYGLFGYIWAKSRFEPQLGLYVAPSTTFILMLWLVICWTGKVGAVANWAHTVGLAGGAIIGCAPAAWRRMKR